MFITQEQVSTVLDNYFTTSDGKFDQQYFDHSLQLILDNHHDLYDRMRYSDVAPGEIVRDALRRFAQEACEDEYGDVQGLTTYMLIRWLLDKTTVHNPSPITNTITYINTERAEAQKEKEDTTMKNNDIINDIENIALSEEEERFCAECGCLIEGEGVEIDGEWYCEDCVEEHFVKCCDCGEYIRKDDVEYYYHGDPLCESCYLNDYSYCELCDDIERLDDLTWVESEQAYICEDCLETHYTRCDHCNEWVRNSSTYTVYTDGDQIDTAEWCESCFENYAWRCEECDEWFSDDVSDNGCCTCDSCYGGGCDTGDINTWKSPKNRMPYGYKPIPCMCATQDERDAAGDDWEKKIIFYGFELEIDRRSKNVDVDDESSEIVDKLPSTYCKTDCSLDLGGSYSGIEIVSHPATLAWYMEHKEDFTEAFDMLKGNKWLSHDAGTCGLHVHVSLHALEDQNPMAVNNLLYIFDHFWDKLVKFSRRNEDQLDRWARRYSIGRGEYSTIKNMAKRECGRYMAVNLQNTHTVELRMFRGTLNPESFFATLQLVDTIIKRCVALGDDYRALQALTWEELTDTEYPELNAYLARRGLKEGCEEQPEPRENDGPEPRKFNIGDRVRVARDIDDASCVLYHEGVVVDINVNRIAVNFADDMPELLNGLTLHNLNHLLTKNTGWWVTDSALDLVEDNDFIVGRRVEVRDDYTGYGASEVRGMTGYIRHVEHYNSRDEYAVELDSFTGYGHACDGHCDVGHGIWFQRNALNIVHAE